MLSETEKKRKLREDDIKLTDLPDYLQKKAVTEAKVHIAKVGKWTRVGDTFVLVKSTGANMDDAWADIVVRKNTPFLNWILLPIAGMFGGTESVLNWDEIANTKIILDFWYTGDGTGGTPIVFQSK